MKAFLWGLVVLVVVAAGAFVYLKYFYQTPANTGASYQTEAVTKTGMFQKSNVAGSDFTHVVIESGKSTGVASYSLNLDDYVGKKVTVTGQFSGTTLYADTVTVDE